VARATPGIDTLTRDEYEAGSAKLRRTIQRYRPPVVALVGVTVFRALFPERRGPVTLGLQKERIGESAVFVLPNPSGRNANYTYAEMLRAFRSLAMRARRLAL
jgi:TDG/mug DNA glycosylase family protein